MRQFSRRSFLGGLLGALAAWLGGKATPAPAQPVSNPVPASPMTVRQDPLCQVTTYVYDAHNRLLSQSTHVTTYSYDLYRRAYQIDPPPQPPPAAQEPPASS
jgi:hypothetical protein